jgi:hypothetical protein
MMVVAISPSITSIAIMFVVLDKFLNLSNLVKCSVGVMFSGKNFQRPFSHYYYP